jgi:UDP-glucose 4-epimerase
MKSKRHVIITGGAGFIGSHIASRLLTIGHEVTILDDLSTGRLENLPDGATFIKIDLSQQDAYGKLGELSGDAVFHLAGQSSGEASFYNPWHDFASHVISTFLLLQWCKRKEIGRLLYASSMSIYGDPVYLPVDEQHPQQPKTFYGAGKIAAESYIKLYQNLGINTTIFRLFSVYGPGQDPGNKMQGMASIFLSYLLSDQPVVVKGSKDRYRDFVYVEDVVQAWLSAWDASQSYGKTYNVASGKKTTVEHLIEVLKGSVGRQDYPIEYREGTPGDQFGVVGDVSLITRDLNWQPKIDLKTGLDKMVSYEKRRMESGRVP